MKITSPKTVLLCYCLLLCTGAGARAQRGPGGGGGGRPPGGGGPPMGGQNQGFPSFSRDRTPPNTHDTRPPVPSSSSTAPTNSAGHGALQLGPPGRWWDDRNFAMSIGLTKNQQRKMDAIFNSNKTAILDNYDTLQKQQSKLDKLTRESPTDQARVFAAIDAVNQARSALEKAYAQMLMQVRQQMDPEQVARMDKLRDPSPPE